MGPAEAARSAGAQPCGAAQRCALHCSSCSDWLPEACPASPLQGAQRSAGGKTAATKAAQQPTTPAPQRPAAAAATPPAGQQGAAAATVPRAAAVKGGGVGRFGGLLTALREHSRVTRLGEGAAPWQQDLLEQLVPEQMGGGRLPRC